MKNAGNLLFTLICVAFIACCLLIALNSSKPNEATYVKSETRLPVIEDNPVPDVRRVNINTAKIEELSSLPGIGESYAARIIEYRTETGGFSDIEEIMEVKGIGRKTFENIKDLIEA